MGIEKLTGQLMDLVERSARRVPGCKLLSLVHAIVASDGPSLSLAERGKAGCYPDTLMVLNAYSIVVASQKRETNAAGQTTRAGDGSGRRSCLGCGYLLWPASLWASSARERTPSLR
jgi:hypothetical protein